MRKKTWKKPEVRTIDAGAAENAKNPGNDTGGANQGAKKAS